MADDWRNALSGTDPVSGLEYSTEVRPPAWTPPIPSESEMNTERLRHGWNVLKGEGGSINNLSAYLAARQRMYNAPESWRWFLENIPYRPRSHEDVR